MYLRVNKQPGANTVEVVDAVKRTLPNLLGLPPGVSVNLTFDQSTYIRQSIQSLWHEASIGSILAFLVILLFLRSFVSTVIISIAIPLSLLLTLVAMYMLGQTLNIFTLGGLALAVGRLVDDSIVELENINRHLNYAGQAAAPRGDRRRPRSGHAHLRVHDHHHRGLHADGLPGGPGQAPLHPADLHHLVLALRLLPRLPDGHAPALPALARDGKLRRRGATCTRGRSTGAAACSSGSTRSTSAPSAGRSGTPRR